MNRLGNDLTFQVYLLFTSKIYCHSAFLARGRHGTCIISYIKGFGLIPEPAR